jgi:hypothetical protein
MEYNYESLTQNWRKKDDPRFKADLLIIIKSHFSAAGNKIWTVVPCPGWLEILM